MHKLPADTESLFLMRHKLEQRERTLLFTLVLAFILALALIGTWALLLTGNICSQTR